MKEVKIEKIIADDQIEVLKKRFLDIVYSDLECSDFIKSNHLSEKKVSDNLSSFLKYLESREKCENCNDLSTCPLQLQGVRPYLDYDLISNQISLQFRKCQLNYFTDELEHNFIIHDFPKSFLKYRLTDTLNDDYRLVRANIVGYLAKILRGNADKGAFIYGPRQVGKTFIAVTFCKTFIETSHKMVAFISPDYIQYLSNISFQAPDELKKLLKTLTDVDLLVFDDFGNEYLTGYVRDNIVYPLLDGRLKSDKITCFTSCYSPSEIQSIYSLKDRYSPKGKQIRELIAALSKPFELSGLPYQE